MFNLFFRRYVPGFRVSPQAGMPGFNIDDNGLPQGTSASSDGTFPESAAQRYPDAAQAQSPQSISFRLPGAEGWVLSAPLIGSPGFRVSPQYDVPGFNVGPQDDAPGFNLDENGAQQHRRQGRVRQRRPVSTRGCLPAHLYNRRPSISAPALPQRRLPIRNR
jgi:hypothetical protein